MTTKWITNQTFNPRILKSQNIFTVRDMWEQGQDRASPPLDKTSPLPPKSSSDDTELTS